MKIELLFRNSLHRPATVAAHIARARLIAKAIAKRFHVREPFQYKVKHFRWILDRWAASKADATRYDYWLTVSEMASLLGHWPDWEVHLQGQWIRQKNNGGRKRRLASKAMKNRSEVSQATTN